MQVLEWLNLDMAPTNVPIASFNRQLLIDPVRGEPFWAICCELGKSTIVLLIQSFFWLDLLS